MPSTQELAETFATKGRELFEVDGYVAPAIFLLDAAGHGLGLVGAPGMHPTDSLGALSLLIAPGMPGLKWIGANVEGWSKVETPGERTTPFRRGELAKAHEALDPTIKTTIVTCMIDVDDPDKSWSIESTNVSPDPAPEWEIITHEGRPMGALPESLLAGAETPLVNAPQSISLEMWAALAEKLGLATASVTLQF